MVMKLFVFVYVMVCPNFCEKHGHFTLMRLLNTGFFNVIVLNLCVLADTLPNSQYKYRERFVNFILDQ